MPSFKKDWEWVLEKLKEARVRGNEYASVHAFLVKEKGDWKNYATCLQIPTLSPVEEIGPCREGVFGPLALMKKQVPLEEITSPETMAKVISTWDELDYFRVMEPNFAELYVYFYGRFNQYHSLPLWMFDFGERAKPGRPSAPGPFLHPKFPPYESVAEAASDWLSDPSIVRNSHPTYQYRCFLASSRAFIQDLSKEADGKLVARIRALDSLSGLLVKMIAKGSNGTVRLTRKASPNVELRIPQDIQELTLYLIDEAGELHDVFEETPFRTSWPKSVLKAGRFGTQAGLLEQIRRGEGVALEFKEWLPTRPDDKKRWDLHQAVVAFANTKGGTILIGVNNHGDIVGVELGLQREYASEVKGSLEDLLEAYERDIRQAVNDGIHPSVGISLDRLCSGGHTVLAINVVPGRNGPYQVIRTNNIYVRRGANNMKPTVDELKLLLEQGSA